MSKFGMWSSLTVYKHGIPGNTRSAQLYKIREKQPLPLVLNFFKKIYFVSFLTEKKGEG